MFQVKISIWLTEDNSFGVFKGNADKTVSERSVFVSGIPSNYTATQLAMALWRLFGDVESVFYFTDGCSYPRGKIAAVTAV